MRRSVVAVVVNRITVAEIVDTCVPVIGKAVKGVDVRLHLPVQLGARRSVAERRRIRPSERLEWRGNRHGLMPILVHVLGIEKKESLVFDQTAADLAPEIASVPGQVLSAGYVRKSDAVSAEKPKSLAVKGIRACKGL